MKFVFDRLSVPFVIMTFVLCGVIAAFASRYLHRDEGFHRFFIFFSFFQLGMILVLFRASKLCSLDGNWSDCRQHCLLPSSMIVRHRYPTACEFGLSIESRTQLLVAALTLHHLSGSGDFGGCRRTVCIGSQRGWRSCVAGRRCNHLRG